MSDGDDLRPDEYERATGIAKEDYETRLLASARSCMVEPLTIEEDEEGAVRLHRDLFEGGRVESVSLRSYEDRLHLVATLRLDVHPRCLYGWRVPVWPAPDPDDPVEGTPEGRGELHSVHLAEAVETLASPPPCDEVEGEVVWLSA